MIHHFSQSPEVLERWYAGPLGDHIDGFAKLLFDQGYATNTAQTKIRLVADLSRWLERKQLTVRDLDENRINEYLRFRANHLTPSRNDQPTFRALLKQLRNDGPYSLFSTTCQGWTDRSHRERLWAIPYSRAWSYTKYIGKISSYYAAISHCAIW